MNEHILNKYFDKIYVLYINQFELERIRCKIDQRGIKVQYHLGVNGELELSEKFKKYISDSKHISKQYIQSIGAFGHIHSIINIINDAIKYDYKKILILEPDIYFCKNFENQVEKYLQMDYKLLYLGASQHNWTYINKNYTNLLRAGYYFAYHTCGTFGICIDNSIFEEYLDTLNDLTQPSDVCIFKLQDRHRDKCIVTYPNLISCDVTKSTTSGWKRNQIEYAKKFKWTREYELTNRLMYNIDKNFLYKVSIELNSFDNLKRGTIYFSYDNNYSTPTVDIPSMELIEKKNVMIDKKSITKISYILHCYSKTDKIFINTNNINIDNVSFYKYPKLERQYIVHMFSKYLKSQNNGISMYYNDLINKII